MKPGAALPLWNTIVSQLDGRAESHPLSLLSWSVLIFLLALAGCAVPNAERQSAESPLEVGRVISGEVSVVSAEVLRIEGHELALAGILAPPVGQRCIRPGGKRFDCGLIAQTALMDLTAGATAHCRIAPGTDDAGLQYARCSIQGYDLSEGMVYTGWAIAWPRTLQPLRRLEAGARKDRRGMWNGRFAPDWLPSLEGV